MSEPGQDESRRSLERSLAGARGGHERGEARVRVASVERRRGQLDLAALALEQAIREGAPLDLAGAEVAALLAEDPGDPGAFRALACFAAVLAPAVAPGPFPLARIGASAVLAARRGELFKATFRNLGGAPTLRLARAVAHVVKGPGGKNDVRRWRTALARPVEPDEAVALDELYGRLLASERVRVTARLDTPGPIREVASDRVRLAGRFAVAAHGEQSAYVVRWAPGAHGPRLLLRDLMSLAGQWVHSEGPVLADAPPELEPWLVAAAGGAFTFGLADGELHVSFAAPATELSRKRHRVGPGVQIAAACPCADGVAVFLDSGGRYFSIGTDLTISRERRLGPGLEVVSAASADASNVIVLARSTRDCVLVRLDADLTRVGEPVAVPPLRSPRDARVEWPTPDLVLVMDVPDVAHAFGADDRTHAWTARIAEPLEALTSVASEALELLAHGAIESEWGQPDGDLGFARWTRDGLGRLGPTVRVETLPGSAVREFEVSTRGSAIVLAHREDDGREGDPEPSSELVIRLLEPLRERVSIPPDREWTFALEGPPPDADP